MKLSSAPTSTTTLLPQRLLQAQRKFSSTCRSHRVESVTSSLRLCAKNTRFITSRCATSSTYLSFESIRASKTPLILIGWSSAAQIILFTTLQKWTSLFGRSLYRAFLESISTSYLDSLNRLDLLVIPTVVWRFWKSMRPFFWSDHRFWHPSSG